MTSQDTRKLRAADRAFDQLELLVVCMNHVRRQRLLLHPLVERVGQINGQCPLVADRAATCQNTVRREDIFQPITRWMVTELAQYHLG